MAKGSSIKDVHKILAKIDLPLSLVPCFCLHWPNPFALPLRTSAPRLECKMLAVYCLPSLPVAIRPAIVATGNASAVIEGEGNLLSLICRLSQCWWPRTASDRAGGGVGTTGVSPQWPALLLIQAAVNYQCTLLHQMPTCVSVDVRLHWNPPLPLSTFVHMRLDPPPPSVWTSFMDDPRRAESSSCFCA